jgi:cysteine synthase
MLILTLQKELVKIFFLKTMICLLFDHFEKVTDKDGAIYARKLAKEEGIFCGYSAGSALLLWFR